LFTQLFPCIKKPALYDNYAMRSRHVVENEKNTGLGHYSDPSLLVLASLANGPKHGRAMIEDIASLCGTHLGAGTLYGAIARLEQQGWIQPRLRKNAANLIASLERACAFSAQS
jgi:hypothetical protein